MKTDAVFSFYVTVKTHPDWGMTINARTPGEAKAEYFRDLRESWPDIPYTALRCQRIGAAESSERFIHNAEYRGLPNARCGDRVMVGENGGAIVSHDASANFIVLFDDDSKYRGQRLSVHPSELKLVEK